MGFSNQEVVLSEGRRGGKKNVRQIAALWEMRRDGKKFAKTIG